jgi:hypothetical protein
MIETAIRSILVNDAAVKAITARCYPVMIPQNPTCPLILYAKISGPRDHHLEGPSGLANPRMQVEAWDATYGGAKKLAEAIRKALDGYTGIVSGVKIGSCLLDSERDIYEPELKVHRTIMDFTIWHTEN